MSDPRGAVTLRALSYGGGWQSTALLLASDRGLVPRFDVAIFADTGSERPATYEWVEFMQSAVSIPIVTVRRKPERFESLFEHVMSRLGAFRMDNPPFSTRGHDEDDTIPLRGGRDPLIQKCTREWKTNPIEAEIKRLLGALKHHRVPKGCYAEGARGISLDEAHRMKPSRVPWIVATYPLIEQLRWRREDCGAYVRQETGREPAKSACGGCPHATSDRWLAMYDEAPEEFKLWEYVDQEIREKTPGTKDRCYLHRSGMPLRAAVEETIRYKRENPSFFDAEDFGCDEGHCGV